MGKIKTTCDTNKETLFKNLNLNKTRLDNNTKKSQNTET